jgi:hypothetical protein
LLVAAVEVGSSRRPAAGTGGDCFADNVLRVPGSARRLVERPGTRSRVVRPGRG